MGILAAIGIIGRFLNKVNVHIISPVIYYVVVNDSLVEHSKYKKGLRQGHPIFHYLFVICVVVLTRLIARCSNF